MLEPDGTRRWSSGTKIAATAGPRWPLQLAIGTDGTIVVAGSDGDRFLATAYDAAGERGWTRRIDGVPGEADEATSVALDPSGNTYLTGPVGGGFGGFLTARIDVDGTVAWTQTQQGALSSTLGRSFVAITSDGRAVVSGVTESTCGVPAATTWSLDLVDGSRDWRATYPRNPCDSLDTRGLDVRPDGTAVIVGSFLATSGYENVVVSYGTDGREEWAASYGTSGTDIPSGILAAGVVTYVTGVTDSALPSMDVLTAAFDRHGRQRWLDRYDSGSTSEGPTNLVLVPGGDLVTTGSTWRESSLEDVLTISYDPYLSD